MVSFVFMIKGIWPINDLKRFAIIFSHKILRDKPTKGLFGYRLLLKTENTVAK